MCTIHILCKICKTVCTERVIMIQNSSIMCQEIFSEDINKTLLNVRGHQFGTFYKIRFTELQGENRLQIAGRLRHPM
jgi:hypothetical protein